MGQHPASTVRMTVFASLCTALIIVGGQLSLLVPFSPVPVVLADLFVMLAGLVLGVSWGLMSVGLFVFLGALGLPVFAQGKAGLAVLAGPTGGYIVGYLGCVIVIGLIVGRGRSSVVRDVGALVAGNLMIYAGGVPWLMAVTQLSWDKALAAGVTPFIVGIVVKIVVASGLARVLRPQLKQTVEDSAVVEE